MKKILLFIFLLIGFLQCVGQSDESKPQPAVETTQFNLFVAQPDYSKNNIPDSIAKYYYPDSMITVIKGGEGISKMYLPGADKPFSGVAIRMWKGRKSFKHQYYINGVINKVETIYENGVIESRQNYDSNGHTNGEYKEWYKTENIKLEGFYTNEYKSGDWVSYDETGNVTEVKNWSNIKQDSVIPTVVRHNAIKLYDDNSLLNNDSISITHKITSLNNKFDVEITVTNHKTLPIFTDTVNIIRHLEFDSIQLQPYYRIYHDGHRKGIDAALTLVSPIWQGGFYKIVLHGLSTSNFVYTTDFLKNFWNPNDPNRGKQTYISSDKIGLYNGTRILYSNE